MRKDPAYSLRFFLATALALVMGLLLIVASYTTFFRHFGFGETGHIDGPIKALRYWTGEHAKQRIFGEFHFYIPILLIYEFLFVALLVWGVARTLRRTPWLRGWVARGWAIWSVVLLLLLWPYDFQRNSGIESLFHMTRGWHLWLAIELFVLGAAACVVLVTERRLIHAFFLWWTLGAFLAYSYAGEKVPWVSVHMVVPLIISAALFVQEILHGDRGDASVARESAGESPTPQTQTTLINVLSPLGTYAASSTRRLCGSALIALALAATTAVALRLCFVNGANPAERHVYNHTAADYRTMAYEVRDMIERTGSPQPAHFIPGESLWPGQWYFRDWRLLPAAPVVRRQPVIILDEYRLEPNGKPIHALSDCPWLLQTHIVRRVPFREWWHQEPHFVTFTRLFDIWMAIVPKQYRRAPVTDAYARPIGFFGDRGRVPNMTVGHEIAASRHAWRSIYDYLVHRIDFGAWRAHYQARDHQAVLVCIEKRLYKQWIKQGGRHATTHSRRVRRVPAPTPTQTVVRRESFDPR